EGFSQAQVLTILDTTLGPIGSPKPPMPIAYGRSTATFPTANTTLNSTVNTTVTDGVINILDATVGFDDYAVIVRDLVLGAFTSSATLPGPNSTSTYTATNIPISFQINVTGEWEQGAGAVTMGILISNAGLANTLVYSGSPPRVTNYTLKVTSFTGNANY